MGLFDRFINATRRPENLSFPIVSSGNPVRWRDLAAAVTGSFVAAIAAGIAEIPAVIADAWTSLLTGASTFITGSGTYVRDAVLTNIPGVSAGSPGLLDVTLGALGDSVNAVWMFNVEQFGILAGPVTVGITLAALFIVRRGTTEAVDILKGGN